MSFLFKWVIFRFYVDFQGCSLIGMMTDEFTLTWPWHTALEEDLVLENIIFRFHF